jgi:polysaccharide export outer membrane protein
MIGVAEHRKLFRNHISSVQIVPTQLSAKTFLDSALSSPDLIAEFHILGSQHQTVSQQSSVLCFQKRCVGGKMNLRFDATTMNKGVIVVALLLLGPMVAGCDGARGTIAKAEAAMPVSNSAAYHLTTGDKIKVTVYNEQDLTGEFQVNDAGNVSFPLAGDIPASGATVSEFERRLTAKLRKGLVRNPRVSVEVSSYRPFNVIGEVKNAGQYPYRPGLTLNDAVAMAGGFTYRANQHTAYIRRADATGEKTVHTDNEQMVVAPGDNIRIPERYF